MPAPKAFPQRREYTPEPAQARAEQAREDVTRLLATIPFLRGRLVSVTFDAGGAKVVRHGLGVAAAFIVVRHNYGAGSAGILIAEGVQTGVDLTQSLAVQIDQACVLDLWFYPRASKTIDAGQGQSL